jgi:hypothetical protein
LPAFHGDPETIRLLDYANALAATKKYADSPVTTGSPALDFSAPVFALALLAKLGFGKQVESLTFSSAPSFGEDLTADLAEAARTGRRSGERAILVLGGSSEERIPVGAQTLIRQQKGEGSYAAAWTISKTHAVFPIHMSDVPSFRFVYESINDDLTHRLDFTVEIHDENLLPDLVIAPQLLQAALGTPIVGTPKSLDEAIANITKTFPKAPMTS